MTDTNETSDLELSATDAENIAGGRMTPVKKAKKKHSTPAQTSYVVNARKTTKQLMLARPPK